MPQKPRRRATGTPSQRFWSKVERNGECLEWTGCTQPNGYGKFAADGRTWLAHRFAYLDRVGVLPDGLVLDHLCRNRACVNPEHLEPVTAQVNLLRGPRCSRTHCAHGHPMVGRNVYFENRTDRLGGVRRCRTCRAIQRTRRQRRHSAA